MSYPTNTQLEHLTPTLQTFISESELLELTREINANKPQHATVTPEQVRYALWQRLQAHVRDYLDGSVGDFYDIEPSQVAA